jgi:hypothetical protein
MQQEKAQEGESTGRRKATYKKVGMLCPTPGR